MNDNDLKKFIAFTKDLLNSVKDNQEYAWFVSLFKDEIVNDLFNVQTITTNTPVTNKFDAITEQDINRVKAYLNFIDRKAVNYGREFYKDVVDDELKKILIDDFKEMKIALKNDDIIEFGRRLCLQIERIYNASLTNLKVHDLINSNKDVYSKLTFQWNEKLAPYDYDLYSAFFAFDRENKVMKSSELSKVTFNNKTVFLSNHFNFRVNKYNHDDIWFLRNKGSHGSKLDEKEAERVKKIINKFDSSYSFYYKVLYDIKINITNI